MGRKLDPVFAFIAVVAFTSAFVSHHGAAAVKFVEQVEASVLLGNATVNITSVQKLNDDGSPTADLAFLNLHENENTSVLAAKTVVYWYGGSLYFLQHGGDRLITFEMNGTTYVFDPNRMFTPIGRRKTLMSYSTYSPAADAAVTALANKVLEIYKFQARRIVVAIHNNGPNYSAADYLPGGEMASDAKAVTILPGSNPHNFFFVTRSLEYNLLDEEKLNVVLQADPVNGSLTDDGSLSVYASMSNKAYVNVEARAEYSGEGIMVIEQMIMFEKMAKKLFPKPIWTTIDWRIGGPLIAMIVVTLISLGTSIFFCRRSQYHNYEMMT